MLHKGQTTCMRSIAAGYFDDRGLRTSQQSKNTNHIHSAKVFVTHVSFFEEDCWVNTHTHTKWNEPGRQKLGRTPGIRRGMPNFWPTTVLTKGNWQLRILSKGDLQSFQHLDTRRKKQNSPDFPSSDATAWSAPSGCIKSQERALPFPVQRIKQYHKTVSHVAALEFQALSLRTLGHKYPRWWRSAISVTAAAIKFPPRPAMRWPPPSH